jgi:hypothetical protein
MTVTGVLTLTTSQFGCPAGDGVCGYSTQNLLPSSVYLNHANVGVLTGGSQEDLEMYLDPAESRRPHGVR